VRRTVFILLGLVTGAIGLAAIAAAIGIFVKFGTDGRFETRQGAITVNGVALATQPSEITGSAPLRLGVGTITVTASSKDPNRAVFLGVAKSADVEAYLAGTNYQVVTDVSGDPLDVKTKPSSAPGTRAPANPVDQTFWVVRATGPGEQQLTFDIQSGAYRLVMMPVDATAPVDVLAQFGVKLPWIFPVGIVLVTLGAVILFIAITFFASSGRKKKVSVPAMQPTGPLPTPLGGIRGPTP
jgi:hypothetical protein